MFATACAAKPRYKKKLPFELLFLQASSFCQQMELFVYFYRYPRGLEKPVFKHPGVRHLSSPAQETCLIYVLNHTHNRPAKDPEKCHIQLMPIKMPLRGLAVHSNKCLYCVQSSHALMESLEE